MSKPGKTYIGLDVLEATRRRISWIFDTHQHVVSCVSGGKDGHALFEVAYAEARRRGRPIHVAYLDQELELQSTINVISENMRRPGVVPLWYQCPVRDEFHISLRQRFFSAWEPGADWMRAKDSIAIHEPPTGFPAGPTRVGRVEMDAWTSWRDWLSATMGEGAALLIGDRADETVQRYLMVSQHGAVPGATWSKRYVGGTNGATTFYPIYDWTVDDVWAFLARAGVRYNRFYDYYESAGVPAAKQRAGYLMSRNSFKRMADVQAFEPETYDRLVERTGGLARVAAEWGRDDAMFLSVARLPAGFETWGAYRDFLLSELADDEADVFRRRFSRGEDVEVVHRLQVRQLVRRDLVGFHALKAPRDKRPDPAVARASMMSVI